MKILISNNKSSYTCLSKKTNFLKPVKDDGIIPDTKTYKPDDILNASPKELQAILEKFIQTGLLSIDLTKEQMQDVKNCFDRKSKRIMDYSESVSSIEELFDKIVNCFIDRDLKNRLYKKSDRSKSNYLQQEFKAGEQTGKIHFDGDSKSFGMVGIITPKMNANNLEQTTEYIPLNDFRNLDSERVVHKNNDRIQPPIVSPETKIMKNMNPHCLNIMFSGSVNLYPFIGGIRSDALALPHRSPDTTASEIKTRSVLVMRNELTVKKRHTLPFFINNRECDAFYGKEERYKKLMRIDKI